MSKINNEDLFKKLEIDLTKCISDLDIKPGDNIYVTGNIGLLGKVKIKKKSKLEILFKSFQNNIGDTGTIFSPAASMNLCNTAIPFDVKNTPSHKMGVFAEFIRTLPNSIRSFHPFWSIVGVGTEANRLKKVSRHAYGTGSPWSHFLDLDVTQINIGMNPSNAVTLIHHIETIVGAPYRYTKEFLHPVVHNGKVNIEPFYQSVFYQNSDIRKKVLLNQHYFKKLDSQLLVNKSIHSSGLEFTSFKMKDFYKVALEYFVDDIYNYLEHVPSIKPYSS
jgi:aminoglycoside 3-N-acetyltransferase